MKSGLLAGLLGVATAVFAAACADDDEIDGLNVRGMVDERLMDSGYSFPNPTNVTDRLTPGSPETDFEGFCAIDGNTVSMSLGLSNPAEQRGMRRLSIDVDFENSSSNMTVDIGGVEYTGTCLLNAADSYAMADETVIIAACDSTQTVDGEPVMVDVDLTWRQCQVN